MVIAAGAGPALDVADGIVVSIFGADPGIGPLGGTPIVAEPENGNHYWNKVDLYSVRYIDNLNWGSKYFRTMEIFQSQIEGSDYSLDETKH